MSSNLFIRTGTAVIEIDRIKKAAKNPKFFSRYFSSDEVMYLVKHNMSPYVIAENYCAKIAFAKAIGTGLRIVKAHEISVLRDRLGSPYITTDGMAKMLTERECYVYSVSVAHCKTHATASIVLYRK